jgi:hypothetical protein
VARNLSGALSVFDSLERLLINAPCSTASNRREAIMTVGEYEERFWRTTPSVHQTFAASRGRDQRQRRLRIWIAAATVAVLSITCSVAHRHHGQTTTGQGQRLAMTVSDEFRLFL